MVGGKEGQDKSVDGIGGVRIMVFVLLLLLGCSLRVAWEWDSTGAFCNF